MMLAVDPVVLAACLHLLMHFSSGNTLARPVVVAFVSKVRLCTALFTCSRLKMCNVPKYSMLCRCRIPSCTLVITPVWAISASFSLKIYHFSQPSFILSHLKLISCRHRFTFVLLHGFFIPSSSFEPKHSLKKQYFTSMTFRQMK